MSAANVKWSPQQVGGISTARGWLMQCAAELRQGRRLSQPILRIFGFAGTGKTTIARHLADGADGQTCYCAFTGKAALMMARNGCHGASTIHGLIYQVKEGRNGATRFVLDKASPAASAALIVVDECFVAGTEVDTPSGPRRIETLTPGDEISNAVGNDRIVAVMRKEAHSIVLINAGGKVIACSQTHRFFTQRGLVGAIELKPGDAVIPPAEAVRLLRDGVLTKEGDGPVLLGQLFRDLVDAFPTVQGKGPHQGGREEGGSGKGGLPEIGVCCGYGAEGGDQGTKARTLPRDKGKDQCCADSQRAQAAAGREWPGNTEAASLHDGGLGAGVGAGVCNTYGSEARGIPDLLQDRLGGADKDDRLGDRRRIAREPQDAGGGQEEIRLSGWLGVDSIEVIEPGDHRLDQYRDADGRLYLYDLQAARHSSFSVNGGLVHNCSMVDEELALDLLSFGRPILVLGDPAQLPPVKGAGYFINAEPDVMLTEIHRQARDNPIIAMATLIREGGQLELGTYGASRVIERGVLSPEEVKAADQILVGKNATRTAYNRRMRSIYGFTDPLPMKGDRLVCLRNDKSLGIFNGGLFTVDSGLLRPNPELENTIRFEVKSEDFKRKAALAVDVRREFFDGTAEDIPWQQLRGTQQFDFGYALTCHKAQGSQWGSVIVYDESSTFREDARRWAYTAVTRAAEKVTVVQ